MPNTKKTNTNKAEGIYKRVMPTLMKNNPPKNDTKKDKSNISSREKTQYLPGGDKIAGKRGISIRDSYGGSNYGNTDLLPYIKKGAKAVFNFSLPGMISNAVSGALSGSKKDKSK